MKARMLALLLGLALGAAGQARAAEDPAKAAPLGLRIGAAEVKAADCLFTPKPAYVHVILDLFPYREALKASGLGLTQVAQALADGPVAAKHPKAKAVKVALVEYPERDDYGAPRWDKVVVLGKFEGPKKGKGFDLKPAAKK